MATVFSQTSGVGSRNARHSFANRVNMCATKVLTAATLILSITSATYHQTKIWSGNSFFDAWQFETRDDPTHGTVDYQPQSSGLAFYDSGTNSVIMKVDNTGPSASFVTYSISILCPYAFISCVVFCCNSSVSCTFCVHSSGRGRKSIRISSYESFNEGLFVLDTNRIPWGCGVWPAFWMVGSNWPNNGEIDIIEEVHNSPRTGHTLHTANTCDYRNYNTDGLFTGTWGVGRYGNENRNCWVDEPTQWDNQGCTQNAADGTHGESWTVGGGGVTVVQWERNMGIKIWDLKRSDVPSIFSESTTSISDSDLSALGKPAAYFPFGSHCPEDTFNNNKVLSMGKTVCLF